MLGPPSMRQPSASINACRSVRSPKDPRHLHHRTAPSQRDHPSHRIQDAPPTPANTDTKIRTQSHPQKNLEFLVRRRLRRRHRRRQHEFMEMRIPFHIHPRLLPPRARPITAPMDGLPIRKQRHASALAARIPRQRILEIPDHLKRRIRLVSAGQTCAKNEERIIATRRGCPDERQNLGRGNRLPGIDLPSQGDGVHTVKNHQNIGKIRSPRSPGSSTPSTAPTAPSPPPMHSASISVRAVRGNRRWYGASLR